MFSFILNLLQALISSKPTLGNLKRGMNVYTVDEYRPYKIVTSFIIDRRISFVKCQVEYLIASSGDCQNHTFRINKYSLKKIYCNGIFASRETAFRYRAKIAAISNDKLRRKNSLFVGPHCYVGYYP